MKAGVILLSIVLVALGLWMVAHAFLPANAPASGQSPAAQAIGAAPQPVAGPVLIGLALTAGGVLFLVLAAKRSRR